MKRSRVPLLVAAVVVLVAAVGFFFGRRPGPPTIGPSFVEPEVTEFTPAGLARFREDVAAAIRALPPDSSYRGLDPTIELFVRQALRCGKVVEAYRAAEPHDRQAVYRGLAGRLYIQHAQRQEFEELTREYERDFPGDGWPTFFRADRHARYNEWAAAEPLYAAAAIALPGESTVRHGWSRCLLQLGQWWEAYEAADRSREMFRQVAAALLNDSNAAGLQKLIDLHRSAVPDDLEAIYFQGWAHRLRQEYAEADRTWFEYRGMIDLQPTSLVQDSGHAVLVAAVDHRFRELLANNRIVEAQALVDRPPTDFRERVLVWRAILAARDGDAAEVIRQLDAVRQAVPTHDWWNDEELRQLIESDGMAVVRERFPRRG